MLSQQSAFTASLKDIPWYIYLVIFSLAIIAGHSSATGLAYLNLTLCARKELWVIHSYCERRTLPIPSSEIFWVTQSYQRTIVSIVLFTSQNLAKMSLVGSGNWPWKILITPWTLQSQVHKSTKRTATINVRNLSLHLINIWRKMWRRSLHSDFLYGKINWFWYF